MEYVGGKDLGAAMSHEQAARGRAGREGLPVAVKLWVMAEVAKALDYAHRRRGDDGRRSTSCTATCRRRTCCSATRAR